jgi:hypothetical protein
MNSISAHRKETFILLGGTLLFLVLVFGGIIALRTRVVGDSSPTTAPTENVDQVVLVMNAVLTSQSASTQQSYLVATATSISLTVKAPTSTSTSTPTITYTPSPTGTPKKP